MALEAACRERDDVSHVHSERGAGTFLAGEIRGRRYDVRSVL
jgi:hypothetical protein